MGAAVAEALLRRLLDAGRLLEGAFRPGGNQREWCDPEVLRSLRRRSLAKLRKEVEPVEPPVLARFLTQWQGVTRTRPRARCACSTRSSSCRGSRCPRR